MATDTTGLADNLSDEILGDFLDESHDYLGRLNKNLLLMDEWVGSIEDDKPSSFDDDVLNEMFRAAHSLKGLSGMLGFIEISDLTHKVENIFDAARQQQFAIDAPVVELLFRAVDCLESMVNGIRQPDTGKVDCETILRDVQRVIQLAGVERDQVSQEDVEQALTDEVAVKPHALLAEGRDAGDDATILRAATQAQSHPSTSQENTRPSQSSCRPTETLRVDIERLDQLMSLSGQLVINKARFAQIYETMKNVVTTKQAARLQLVEKVSDPLNGLIHEQDAPNVPSCR